MRVVQFAKFRFNPCQMWKILRYPVLLSSWLLVANLADADVASQSLGDYTNIVWQGCGNGTGNANSREYTEGSAFDSNLNEILNSTTESVSSSGGYNISQAGQNGDRVYGLVQCRGDLGSSDCKRCAKTAKANLVKACHNTSGFIQQDGCFLRYDTFSFYNDLQSLTAQPVHSFCNSSNSSNAQQLSNAVKTLLINISSVAAQSANYFVATSVAVPSSRNTTIFSIAQCWMDLSETNCGSCLTEAYSSLLQCQAGALGAQFESKNCYLRYETFPFFNTSVLSPSSTNREARGKRSKAIPVTVGLVVAAVVIVTFLWFWKRNLFSFLQRERSSISESRGYEGREMESPLAIANPELNFTYEVMQEATSNFRAENKIGEGGFGSVYRGILPDGREVAIKRLFLRSRQGDAEFLNEINLISRVQHKNLVKLLGCCIHGSERLLLYEYLPNKSLDKFLFDPKKRHLLDWKKSKEIIVGTARGLAYLHEESVIRIIHRDIKASNILLDEKFGPKIADFGLARLIGDDQTHLSTRAAGTLGYMAPEYAFRGQLTQKADVFSFGILVLEIISGKKNQSLNDEMQFLLEGTWRLYEDGNASKIIDPILAKSYSEEENISIRRVIQIALLCTQAAAALRPPMSRVVLMLTSPGQSIPVPTKPAFIDSHTSQPSKMKMKTKTLSSSEGTGASSSSSSFQASSVADVSASGFLEPR